MSSHLRRIYTGLLLLCGLCAGGHAWAATNCKVSGAPVDVAISPCPYTKDFKFGTESPVSIHVDVNGKLPSRYFVLLSQSAEVIQPNTFRLTGTFNSFNLVFSTYNKIPSGKHAVQLDVKICSDSACKNVLADAGLPSTFDSVVPPALSGLLPGSATLHGPAFTLKVTGGGFTSDCKIHLGATILATTFVSIKEVTAKVSLSTATRGQVYTVTVVPATGIASNALQFTLKNPVPEITTLNPAKLVVTPIAFALTVTGTGFTSSSKIKWAGAFIPTKFKSKTELTASVDLSTAPSGNIYPVTVTNPTPGGGESPTVTFEWDNAAPVITSISPSSKLIQTQPTTLIINGSGFQQNSVVNYTGAALLGVHATYVSPIELEVQNFWPNDAASDQTVTVVAPSPGGGTSNGATFELDEPTPTLSWVSPNRAYAGSGDITLTVEGINFNNDTQVRWNGAPLTVVGRFSTSVGDWITATLPAADLATATSATVSVFAPSPGGGNPGASFTVLTHPPQIATLSPGFIAPGSGDFTLTLDGVDFDSAATVTWNGDILTPNAVTSTEIQVTVPAADIIDLGVAEVTVVNPASAGGTSAPASLAVDASGSTLVAMPQTVGDLAWDSAKFVFYGSAPAADINYPDSILTIDPAVAAVTASKTVSEEPKLLSLSGDGAFLYVSFPSSIHRLSTPGMASTLTLTDLNGVNGPLFPISLAASPVMPYGLAAIYGVPGVTPSSTGIYMYLDGIQTQSNVVNSISMNSLGFSADGSGLYAGGANGDVAFLTVGSNGGEPFGMKGGLVFTSLWSGGLLHVDAASNLLYGDGSTGVVDPVSRTKIETLPVSGITAPDSSLGCVFILNQTAAQVTAGTNDYTLSCYSTTDQSLTRSIVVPTVNGTPTKMLRWGNEGLAFITDGGYIYFVSGQIVTGN